MPGLKLYSSNRLEVLAQKLAEELNPPLPSPLQGEIILVPRGIEHCPRTRPDEEAQVLVVELLGTTHTGAVKHERTVETYERI